MMYSYTSWADLMYSHGLRMWSVHTCSENALYTWQNFRGSDQIWQPGFSNQVDINSSCFQPYTLIHGPGRLSRYSDSLLAGRLGGRIPVGIENFRTRPDQPWGPTSILYIRYRVSFPGVKRPGRGVNQPRHLAARLTLRLLMSYIWSTYS